MRLIFCVALAAVMTAESASAASKTDWTHCKDVTNKNFADRNMAACTRIINDRTESPHNRGIGYSNRCGIWIMKRDLKKAMDDCEAALVLHQTYPLAYYNRASIWVEKGEYDRAIADMKKAAALGDKDAPEMIQRIQQMKSKATR